MTPESRKPGWSKPSPLMKALILLAMLQAAGEFAGWSWFMLYAHELGSGLTTVVLMNACMWGGALAGLFVVSSAHRYRGFRVGLAIKAAAYLVLATPLAAPALPYLAAIIGFSLNLYWIPYNIVFMDELKNKERATWSCILFMAISVTGVAVPVLAGLLIDSWGFPLLFVAGALVNLTAVAVVDLEKRGSRMPQSSRQIPFATLRNMGRSRNLMLPVTLEGAWDGVVRTSLPVMAIFATTSAGEYGLVLAVFGLGGSAAALLTARYSDARGKRGGPILAAALLGSVFTAWVAFAPDGWPWIASLGLVFFAVMVTVPYNFTAARELSRDSTESMIAREAFLLCGRVLGVMVVLASVVTVGLTGAREEFLPALLVGAVFAASMGVAFVARLRSRGRASK